MSVIDWLLAMLDIVSITVNRGMDGAPGFPDAYDVITIVLR